MTEAMNLALADAARPRRPLNIVYFSCHEVLEYDELRLLTDLGHRVFSIGAYGNPAVGGQLRAPLPQFHHPGDWDAYVAQGDAFLRGFDLAIVMHAPEFVARIAAAAPDMPIVYRSIGQSHLGFEAQLAPFADRLSVVRYSERERSVPGFLPAAAVIHFAKYLADYPPWTGGERLLSFHNFYAAREMVSVPRMAQYLDMTAGLPSDLYGLGNEDLGWARGIAPPGAQMALYGGAALYVYILTLGPSYTLSLIEAMGVGVPIVAPTLDCVRKTADPAWQNAITAFDARFEVADLLDHDPRLLYNSADEARGRIAWLLANPDYCREVSARLRARFAATFDAGRIGPLWDALLYRLVPD